MIRFERTTITISLQSWWCVQVIFSAQRPPDWEPQESIPP
jgi:hypothetical protein